MVNEATIRVLLVDDDPLVRAGLRLILGGSPDIEVVAEGADGSEAGPLVAQHRPDVVLMDIRMPRLDGLVATEQLLARPDAPKVVILTTFDADSMVLRALAVGASGFLLKDTPPARMVEAIRQVAAGEHSLSPTVTAQVIAAATHGQVSSRKDEAQASLSLLTEREHEVALAIGQGMTNAEIARSQYMSIATVKAHVTKILEKLGASNRVQVAIRVHDAGLS
ncbi:response regulator [Aestuariimicrobium kwangyangense]|uniref:response regulator n=1 Tax=Aestuariimicrobium kwangyangense TaxID=396389 RepID=UPI0003B36DA6|nr:response regulator transcription factor [Aestuariimicrobium kwangyangense]